MANYWIKLYHEILRDPKMGRLPDRAWRRCIELFLLAGEYSRDGSLPPVDEIAWILRVDQDELLLDMEQLQEFGILTLGDHDEWIVTNFVTRQDADTDAERKRRSREAERIGHGSVTKRDKSVTNDVTTDVQDIDIDIDKSRLDTETDKSAAAAVFTLYDTEISKLTQFTSDMVGAWIDDYSAEWTTDAIKEAAIYNKRNSAYIETILKNWQANGRNNGKSGKSNSKKQETAPKDYVGGQYAEFIDH